MKASDGLSAGKRVGRGIYVSVFALQDGTAAVTPEERDLYQQALRRIGMVPLSHIVHIQEQSVRFLSMTYANCPERFGDAYSIYYGHPYVGYSTKADLKNPVPPFQMTRPPVTKHGPQIYHRYETILSPFEKCRKPYIMITEYEESIGALGPFEIHGKGPSGYLPLWEKQLESKGISPADLKQRLWELWKKGCGL